MACFKLHFSFCMYFSTIVYFLAINLYLILTIHRRSSLNSVQNFRRAIHHDTFNDFYAAARAKGSAERIMDSSFRLSVCPSVSYMVKHIWALFNRPISFKLDTQLQYGNP